MLLIGEVDRFRRVSVKRVPDTGPAVSRLWRTVIRFGRVAEPAVAAVPRDVPPPHAGRLRRSLQLRQVDAGSCNGCEAEFAAVFGPVYDGERYGVRVVASPRHADGLVVTGPVTRNMVEPLRRTWEATPGPKVVFALGDCACNRGVFADGYGVAGAVGEFVPVDVEIPGCPPAPAEIVVALRRVVDG